MKKAILTISIIAAFLLVQALSATAKDYTYSLSFNGDNGGDISAASLKAGSHTVLSNCNGGKCTGTYSKGDTTLTLEYRVRDSRGSYSNKSASLSNGMNKSMYVKEVACSIIYPGCPYPGCTRPAPYLECILTEK